MCGVEVAAPQTAHCYQHTRNTLWQVKRLASDIQEANKAGKPVVFFTGAGLSTAADIPDYRGPNGVWTRRDKGLPPLKSRGLEGASPTYGHRVMAAMLQKNMAQYIVSQNVDCLHLKSGVPESKLAELHGNSFKETCQDCNTSYLRDFSVRKHKGVLHGQGQAGGGGGGGQGGEEDEGDKCSRHGTHALIPSLSCPVLKALCSRLCAIEQRYLTLPVELAKHARK